VAREHTAEVEQRRPLSCGGNVSPPSSTCGESRAEGGHLRRLTRHLRGRVSVAISAGGEQSVASPQAARGWSHPPCRHFKNQSCCCLGSAFQNLTALGRSGSASVGGVHVLVRVEARVSAADRALSLSLSLSHSPGSAADGSASVGGVHVLVRVEARVSAADRALSLSLSRTHLGPQLTAAHPSAGSTARAQAASPRPCASRSASWCG
jgi:hypothetical protein